MTSDGPALLAAIISEPEEDSVRLAFADWLEEQPPTTYTCHGPHIARDQLGIWMVGTPDGKVDTCRICNGAGELTSGKRNRVRAELIRAQIERARLKPRPLIRAESGITFGPGHNGREVRFEVKSQEFKSGVLFDLSYTILQQRRKLEGCAFLSLTPLDPDNPHDRYMARAVATNEPCPVRARCDELEAQIVRLNKETNHCPELGYTWVNEDYYGVGTVKTIGMSAGHMVRGFVEEVVCTAEKWLKIEGALVWHQEKTTECGVCAGSCSLRGWAHKYDLDCRACTAGGVAVPCPLTAHPIRKVRLTTRPAGYPSMFVPVIWRKEGRRQTWINHSWLGIEFELPPTSYQDQLRPGQETYPPMEWVTTAERLARDANYIPDEIDRVRRGGFQPEPRDEELAGDGPDS